jgi:glycerol uptake facilitator protein
LKAFLCFSSINNFRKETKMAVNKNPTMSQKFVAEVIGTAFLVWVGPGSITTFSFISAGNMPFTLSDLGWIALAFAFAIVAMIYTIGHISGCHINPAVTLAMAVSKRMSWKDARTYWGAQLVGAFIGAGLIGLCYGFTNAAQLGYGATNFSEANTGYLVAILAELVGTFFLLFVIMGSAVDGRAPAGFAGIAIPLAVAADILVFGPVTNVSLNPFRSLAPAVLQVAFGGAYEMAHLAVYFIGPALGAILGVWVYDFITREEPAKSSVLRETTAKAER